MTFFSSHHTKYINSSHLPWEQQQKTNNSHTSSIYTQFQRKKQVINPLIMVLNAEEAEFGYLLLCSLCICLKKIRRFFGILVVVICHGQKRLERRMLLQIAGTGTKPVYIKRLWDPLVLFLQQQKPILDPIAYILKIVYFFI